MANIRTLYALPEDPPASLAGRPHGETCRIALYARFSALTYSGSNAASADQQLEVLDEYAAEAGFKVVGKFKDDAVTGSNIKRDGWQQVIRLVREGAVDGVAVADLSRATRSGKDGLEMLEIFQRHGVFFYCPEMGRVDPNLAATLFVQAQAAISYSRRATRLALRKKAASGRNITAAAFGYEIDRSCRGGLLKIPEQTEIRLSIVADFLAGITIADIIRKLNRRRTMNSAGREWTHRHVVGSIEKPGVLRQPLLAGYIVAGRTSNIGWTEDGKRITKKNPPSTWVVGHDPDLAIVSQELFVEIQSLLDARSRTADRVSKPHHGPTSLLSGRMSCAACGGKMNIKGRNAGTAYAKCDRAHRAADCNEWPSMRTDIVEELLVDRVRSLMVAGDLERTVFQAAEEQIAENRKFSEADLRRAQKVLAEAENKIQRLLSFVTSGRGVAAINDREFVRLEGERNQALADLHAAKASIANLVDAQLPLDRLRRGVSELQSVLAANDNSGPDKKTTVMESFRSLFDRVSVKTTDDRYLISVTGLVAFDAEVVRRKPGRPPKVA